VRRLVIYEIRKLFDTRAALIVVSICVVLAVALGALGLIVRPGGVLTLSEMAAAAVLPFAFVAPILAVLAAASDWRSGTIQHTLFTEPRRERIFFAKLCASVLSSVATSGLTVALSLMTGYFFGTLRGQAVEAGDLGSMLWGVASLVIPGSLFGFGLGALFLSAPLAISLVLLVEIVLDVALSALPNDAGAYFTSASLPDWLVSGDHPLAALSSFALWIATPLGLGLYRYLSAEAR